MENLHKLFSLPTPFSNEKSQTRSRLGFFVGPPGGIRTPGLWNRNPLRYPASPRAVMFGAFLFYPISPAFATPIFEKNQILLAPCPKTPYRNVGTGVLDGPQLILTKYGNIAEKQIQAMNALYENLNVDKYVIMPNHIHLLIRILCVADEYGPSRTPVPTRNSIISRFVSTFKRFCDKEYDENPIKWELDKFYKTR